MATAAFDPTASGDATGPPAPPATGPADLRVGDGGLHAANGTAPADPAPAPSAVGAAAGVSGRWDAVAALVRALAIAFGVTAAGWALARRWPGGGASRPGAYGSWLADLVPVPRVLADAAIVTAQLAGTALAVAVVGGLLLALMARWRRLTGPVTGAGLVLAALAGPALALAARYWLLERRGLSPGPNRGAVGLTTSWTRAVDDLLLPAAAAGLPAAPALAALVTPPRAGESRWWTALAAPLADRGGALRPAAETGPARPVGLPVALLVAGVAAAELVFRRPGLFARLADRSTLALDARGTLDVVAALAVGAVAVALAVDLVALALAPVVARRRARRPEPRPGSETLFAATSGPAVPSARAVRAALAVVAGLAVGGLAGLAVAPRPGPGGGRTFGPPLLDGVLGSDGAGADLLALTASALGRAVIAAAAPALLATVAALALAPLMRRLPRVGRLVPGAAIDALWWPAGIVAVLAVPAIGGRTTLVDPLVLALMALALAPAGLRLAARTAVPARAGRVLHALAVWLLLAPLALTAHVVAGFLGPDAGGPTLGRLLAASLDGLGRSPWPAVWPAVAAGLLAAGCADLGSSLAALSRQRAGRRPDADDEPWALSMRAVHDERPWYDGDGTPAAQPETVPPDTVTPETVTPETVTPETVTPETVAAPVASTPDPGDEPLGEAEPPGGSTTLSPNFSLQPGLPPPELHATVRLPVVRVRLADPDGPDPGGAGSPARGEDPD